MHPLLSLEMTTPENNSIHWTLVVSYARKSASLVVAVLGRMQLALHATRRTSHGASRLVQAMNVYLVSYNPDMLRRGIVGIECLWAYDYGHA